MNEKVDWQFYFTKTSLNYFLRSYSMKKKNSTVLLTKEEVIPMRKWLLLDATGKTLGRFAAEVAKILRGKHKPQFTPHVDTGDGVVIINAEKIVVTGAKEAQKIYRYHTGAMSGMREVPYRTMLGRKPDYIIWHAIKGMMPKTRLSEAQMKKLRIFAGDKHDMKAQTPIPVNI
jgi:large subunit ribosomal protein L13